MPPNPHNTSIACAYRPKNKSRSKPRRQDARGHLLGFSVPPNSIFLLNFDSPYREQLTLVLRHLRYQIFIPEEQGMALRNMKNKEFQQADLILFDLTRLNHDEVWIPLRRICRLRKPDGMPLMVHCFSRIYRGPDFHLLVEKLGARMAYYAE